MDQPRGLVVLRFFLSKVSISMRINPQLTAVFVCLVLSAAEQATASGGPSAVEFKNYTSDVVTVYVAARASHGPDTNETREINGPYVVKPGETQSVFKCETGDLEHVLVCVLCDGRPQWNPPNTFSTVLGKNELDQRADGSATVKLQDQQSPDDFLGGMKFTNKILPDAMRKGESFRFVRTDHKGRGTKTIHYNH